MSVVQFGRVRSKCIRRQSIDVEALPLRDGPVRFPATTENVVTGFMLLRHPRTAAFLLDSGSSLS